MSTILATVGLVRVVGCAAAMELCYRATPFLCLRGVGATDLAAQNASALQLMGPYAAVRAGRSLVAPTMRMPSLGFAHMRRACTFDVFAVAFAGLRIFRNTVNAHRKSDYAKLGVHLQQEPLMVVKDARA